MSKVSSSHFQIGFRTIWIRLDYTEIMSDPRFPIGPLPALPDAERVPATLHGLANSMAQAVTHWQATLQALTPVDLTRTYRPASWTVQQLAHHTADAHLHGLNRLRHGLTQDDFQIQPFGQSAWLTLADAALPVSVAAQLLEPLNAHWVALLRGTPAGQFDRQVVHPTEGRQDLWQLAVKHDWHLRHHLAHVRLALGEQQ